MRSIDISHLRTHNAALVSYMMGSLLVLIVAVAVLWVIVMRQHSREKRKRQQQHAAKRAKGRKRR
ncbi:hypothetical protein [Aquabacterium parvum]|jgi:preprotein translocase subunit YajC|uniref:hypothetical protein n=1 Tax=Aquabacterium parvum TaxID=70584 RepID=UPI000718C4CF|nr:hypothetical protein [Aquabacterium parvum]